MELKPCKRGTVPKIIKHKNIGSVFVQCQNCKKQTQFVTHVKDAVFLWNRGAE